jgi:hypothetical protein
MSRALHLCILLMSFTITNTASYKNIVVGWIKKYPREIAVATGAVAGATAIYTLYKRCSTLSKDIAKLQEQHNALQACVTALGSEMVRNQKFIAAVSNNVASHSLFTGSVADTLKPTIHLHLLTLGREHFNNIHVQCCQRATNAQKEFDALVRQGSISLYRNMLKIAHAHDNHPSNAKEIEDVKARLASVEQASQAAATSSRLPSIAEAPAPQVPKGPAPAVAASPAKPHRSAAELCAMAKPSASTS